MKSLRMVVARPNLVDSPECADTNTFEQFSAPTDTTLCVGGVREPQSFQAVLHPT